MKDLKTHLEENYEGEDFIIFDGFDDAFLGVAYIDDRKTVVTAYDLNKCIQILQKELGDCSEEEAVEFFELNVAGTHVGIKTPIFIERPIPLKECCLMEACSNVGVDECFGYNINE